MGLWLNDVPARRVEHGPGTVGVYGPEGSLWTTREQRVAKGWPDVGEPENMYLVAEQVRSFQASVACTPREHGDQAGLYAYADALSWVKLVVEGTGHGAQLIFAEQHEGAPSIRGKVPLADFQGSVDLQMRADGAAFYKTSGDEWTAMPRGLGWLREDELGDLAYGSLEAGDERGTEPAVACLPAGWRAVLAAEQWQNAESTIVFSNIAHEAG